MLDWVNKMGGRTRSKMIIGGFWNHPPQESKQVVHSLNLPKVLAGCIYVPCLCYKVRFLVVGSSLGACGCTVERAGSTR